MTLYDFDTMVTVKCAVCGYEEQEPAMISCYYPPLEYFHPECIAYQRMYYGAIRICPNCKYAAPTYERLIDKLDPSVVFSDEYKKIANDPLLNECDVVKFTLAAYLYEKTGDFRSAAEEHLHAAWMYESEYYRRSDLAKEARLKVIEMLMKVGCERLDLRARVTLVELYRRTEQYEKSAELARSLLDGRDKWTPAMAIPWYPYCKDENEQLERLKMVLEKEIELCESKDDLMLSVSQMFWNNERKKAASGEIPPQTS